MTTLLTPFTTISPNTLSSSSLHPSPDQTPLSASSTRFSHPPALDSSHSSNSVTPSLLSNLLSHLPSTTLPSIPPTNQTHLSRAPLLRPRAHSSSHLPPPFPSPSGAFLPPPSSQWLPLTLPPSGHRKRPTQSSELGIPIPSNSHRRARSLLYHTYHPQSQDRTSERAKHDDPLAENVYRRSAPSVIAWRPMLIPSPHLRSPPAAPAGPVLVRDFGFPSTDLRHTGLDSPPSAKTGGGATRGRDEDEDRGERAASYLYQPSASVETGRQMFWTTVSPNALKTDEEERGETHDGESDDELRDEIERRRESLDKSLQSIGRLSSGGGGMDQEREMDEEEGLDGLWVAMYNFEAEGESEMALLEGEVVRVIRAVCDGWVVARKVPGEVDENGLFVEQHLGGVEDEDQEEVFGQTGLCPQNYLVKL